MILKIKTPHNFNFLTHNSADDFLTFQPPYREVMVFCDHLLITRNFGALTPRGLLEFSHACEEEHHDNKVFAQTPTNNFRC